MDLLGDAGATKRSRTGEEVITPSFESIWPEVERRLRALLYRRGLDQPSAEDIVQEVALRVLAGRITFTSAKDLLRWAGPVACNLHVDLVRQRARLHDGAVSDRPASNDVAGEVADRMELQRAFRGIAALRPADREAIIDAVTSEPRPVRNRKEAVRLAVRRHRARSRLVVVMEQLAAWLTGIGLLRRSRAAVALVAVPVVVALPLVLHMPGTDSRAVRPIEPVTMPAPYHADRATTEVKAARITHTHANDARPARVTRRAVAKPEKADVEVKGPGDVKVRAGGDDRGDDDGTVCVYGVPVLQRVCV